MRIGSLFTGAGMLDVAAMALFEGSSVAWHCENDRAAMKVLAYRWPTIPNLGDVSAIDWAAVEPVDIITGGFPCQDVSTAGAKAGMHSGSRSGLWSHMRDAIAVHRPRWVLIENVRGLLSAPAVRNLESDSDGLGDNTFDPVLRALGAVLGDLADLGFDADWVLCLASDVGACHRRARVFVCAYPADASSGRPQSLDDLTGSTSACRGWERQLIRSAGGTAVSVDGLLPTPSVADGDGGHGTRSGERVGELLLPGIVRAYTEGALLPTPDTGTSPSGHGRRGGVAGNGYQSGINLDAAISTLPTPDASAGTGGGIHPDAPGREGHSHQLIDFALYYGTPQWGQYEAAIRRQEQLSRPAPSPTEPNIKRRPRLSAAFAEWMMWWPPQWCTDPAIGISRIEQLRIIGNGVCPPQAISAFRYLFSVAGAAA